MELTKQDTKMTKGLAIIFMVILHLFCRKTNLPYDCIKLSDGVPLIYYLGLFGDCCVAIYCFCSGYAIQLICEKTINSREYYKGRLKSLLKFLINFWIVLILFSIVGLLVDKNGTVPGTITDFLGNMFLYNTSYNGAWWFVLTYVVLIAISKLIYIIIQKFNPLVINIIFLLIYVVSYFQRINVIVETNIQFVDFIIRQLALLGTSILPFVWGMYFYKYRLFTKIRSFVKDKIKNIYLIIGSAFILICMMIAHGIVQSLILAPFTGMVTIIIFNLVNKGKIADKIFCFLGDHSTNIWLTHMFFYSVIFKDLVFVARYPLFIFIFMMAITIVVSYLINLIYYPLHKLIK